MLNICSLGSGSRGNAWLIGCDGSFILVDCGLSAKRIHVSLERIGISPEAVEGIVVTHEHRDHVSGLRVFRKRHPVPLFATGGTLKGAGDTGPGPCHTIRLERAFRAGPFHVSPFRVMHDAADPIGLVLESERGSVGITTDLGTVDETVEVNLAGHRALILESNHEEDLLRSGSYPQFLKERILSEHGHLSNRDSRSALLAVADDSLEVVLLAHISEENNTVDLAVEGARAVLDQGGWNGIKVVAADQHQEGEMLELK